MELKKVNELVYYVAAHTNIGAIRCGEKAVILVDTGIDEDGGKKLLRILADAGLNVRAIINTHSHADHCGGNKYIKQRTGAKIYAPAFEAAIITYPLLEPVAFFSGANPPGALRNKFLMAEPSDVDFVIEEGKVKIDEAEIRILPLPGHSINQVGVEAGNVLFCADSLFSADTLEKHKIPFFVDIEKTRQTLRFLRDTKYDFYVPSHSEPSSSLTSLIDRNLEAIDGIERCLLETLRGRKTTEQVLREVCSAYGIEIKTEQQYYLMNTAVMAYLSMMQKSGKAKMLVEDNSLWWEKS